MNGRNDGELAIAKDRQETDGGDLVVVEVNGDLDMAAADRFAAALVPDEETGRAATVIDLTGVGFIDSSGIRVLLAADRALGEAGYRSAVVVAVGSAVARALELAGVDETVNAFPTRAEAIDGLAR